MSANNCFRFQLAQSAASPILPTLWDTALPSGWLWRWRGWGGNLTGSYSHTKRMIWFVRSERHFALILFLDLDLGLVLNIQYCCCVMWERLLCTDFASWRRNAMSSLMESIVIKNIFYHQWKKIVLTMKLTFGGIFIFMKYIFLLITLNLNVLNAVFEFPAQLAGIWNSLKLSIVEMLPSKQRVLGERHSGCGRWGC